MNIKKPFILFLSVFTIFFGPNIEAMPEAVGIDVFGPFTNSRAGEFDQGGAVRADGTSTWFYDMLLVDENFDLVNPEGEEVSISVTGSAQATITCGNTPGQGCTPVITNTVAETVFATVTVNGTEIVLPTDEPGGLVFTKLPVASNTTFTRTGSFTPAANGIDSTTFKFQLNDADNNPLTFGDDEFIISSTGNAQLIDFTDNKDATYSVTLINLTAETINLSITVNGDTYNDIASVTFTPLMQTAGPASAANTSISTTGFDLEANGTDEWNVVIQLVDENGILLASGGDTVLASTNGNASISSVLDRNNGTYSFSITNNTPETINLSISVNGQSIDNIASITFLPAGGIGEADPANTIINVSGFDLVANGSDVWLVNIQLVDSNNIKLVNGGDSVEITVNGNARVNNITDNDDGTYTGSITNNVAETSTIDIVINDTTLTNVVSTIFKPGPISPNQTQITSTTNDDGSVDLIIQLADANGNAITSGGADVIVETSGGATTNGVTDNGDGTYLVTVTNTAGGSTDVSLTINGQASGTVLTDLNIPGEPEPEPATPLNLGSSGGGGSCGWLTLVLLGLLSYKRKTTS